MAKAVLIVDMPESCRKCNLSYMIRLGTRLICHATEMPRVIRTTHDKPDWCPLLELPEKGPELESGYESINRTLHREGWNDCLDKILGETPEKGVASKRGNPAG